MTTLAERRKRERQEFQERQEKERLELEQLLRAALAEEAIEILSIREEDGICGYWVVLAFTLDGYRQEDDFYWYGHESLEAFIKKVKKHINYIKELRAKYPDYCKQNDYIQTNSVFRTKITLTHMGYPKDFYFEVQLADYLKLPNITSCSAGGGDYQIKKTPQRVEEFNRNIDIMIDTLLDCISELKKRKYVPDVNPF